MIQSILNLEGIKSLNKKEQLQTLGKNDDRCSGFNGNYCLTYSGECKDRTTMIFDECQ